MPTHQFKRRVGQAICRPGFGPARGLSRNALDFAARAQFSRRAGGAVESVESDAGDTAVTGLGVAGRAASSEYAKPSPANLRQQPWSVRDAAQGVQRLEQDAGPRPEEPPLEQVGGFAGAENLRQPGIHGQAEGPIAARQYDRILLGYNITKSELGQFTMASDLGDMPTQSLIGPAMTPVMAAFARISGDPERLRNAYLKASRFTMLLAAPTCIGMSLTSDMIVDVLLGAKWKEAAFYLQWLSLSVVLASRRLFRLSS